MRWTSLLNAPSGSITAVARGDDHCADHRDFDLSFAGETVYYVGMTLAVPFLDTYGQNVTEVFADIDVNVHV